MKRKLIAGCWLLFALFTTLPLCQPVYAQVPHLIRYQGQAVDSNGVGLQGPYTLTCRLYDAPTGGNKVWEEAQTNVYISGGYFSIALGSTTSISSVDWSQPLWLAIQVNTDPELSPRQQLTSVPMALMAERLDGPITTVGNNVGIGTTTPAGVLDVSNGKLVVASNGRVGIGTTTPSDALHVRSPSGLAVVVAESSNSAPGFFDGVITQPDGVTTIRAAHIAYDNNTSNSGFLTLYSQGTSKIHLNTNANSYIDGGLVGIGTTSPAYKLDVAGAVRATDFYTASDVQLKTNVTTLSNTLSKVMQLRGVSYDWNAQAQSVGATPGKHEIGVIAQEIAAVFPEVVDGTAPYLAVDYTRLTAVLIQAVKELKTQVDQLQQQVNTLKTSSGLQK